MQVVSLQAYPCWLSGVASNRDILCWQNDVNRCSSSLYSRAGKLKLTIVIYGIITILKNLLFGFCIRQYKLTWTSKFSTDLIRWCVQLALAALRKSNDILKVFNFERYLETIFSRQHSDCTVEQFVQSIKSIHYLVKFFAWLGVMQFIHRSVVRVLFSVIQSTTKKSTYVMLH